MCCFFARVRTEPLQVTHERSPATVGTSICKVLQRAVGLAILVALLQAPVYAAEPILTLAMVAHDVTPLQSTIPSPFSVASSPLPTVHPAEQLTSDFLRTDLIDTRILPSVFLVKVEPSRPGNVFFSTGQYWTERGHSKIWSKIAPGYGYVFKEYSWVVYGRNGYEEPGTGFVKISLDF